jgi:hypothetical protein
MQKDPIVEEVRRIRRRYAERFNFDLDAICADLKERERRGEFVVVYRQPRAPRLKTEAASQHGARNRLAKSRQPKPRTRPA